MRGLPNKKDCSKCYPPLMKENHIAFTLWMLINRQVIMGGMGDIIDINHLSVWKIIDEFENEFGKIDRWETFNKIIQVFSNMQHKQREWSEEEKKEEEKKDLIKKIGRTEYEKTYGNDVEF